MPGCKQRFVKILSVLIFSCLSVLPAFPQIIVYGIVRDEQLLTPLRNVNILINGTTEGVYTGEDGRFSLALKKFPASITISCVGYQTAYYDIKKPSSKPIELLLRQYTNKLQEVDVFANRFCFLYKDKDYSILDYEIMDDNLLLLVYRYQLKHAELILLSLNGDTVAVAPVPELKPQRLYKDFLGYINYFSDQGNAFQCTYNDSLKKIIFPNKITCELLLKMSQSLLFSIGDRVYFQEFTPDGFGKAIGYYDKDYRKEYIGSFSGDVTSKNYFLDMKFYQRWNEQLDAKNPARFSEDDFNALKRFNYRRMNTPFVKLGDDTMAVFNFNDGVIELMDWEGRMYRTVPISFQKEEGNDLLDVFSLLLSFAEWRWSGKIIVDEYYREAYTTFKKNGMVQIRKIDLGTGNLVNRFDLPFPFPKKILIYKGYAYFLIKDIGSDFEKWKLIKLQL
jgi:hypothetical protein